MRGVEVDTHELLELSDGWELAASGPGAHQDPSGIDSLRWSEAVVPGTVAAALPGFSTAELDRHDWWFRTRFDCHAAGRGEELALALDGIATVAEVYLNGRRLLASSSMFAAHELDVGETIEPSNELVICCRALAPLLALRRRPRARWRTRLVSEGNLRFFRTMLLGRAPGFASGPAAVGPWRPVRIERRRSIVAEALRLRPRLEGSDGVLELEIRLRPPTGAPAPQGAQLRLRADGEEYTAGLALSADGAATLARGTLSVPGVRRWWPHTHGEPSGYAASIALEAGGAEIGLDLGRVGFRALHCGTDLARDGIQISVNNVPVFVRGAVWTPPEPARPHSGGEPLRHVLEAVAGGGLNMLRVPATACYESEEFYALCDELGILVWQDFMLANLDYPDQDPDFMSAIADEARAVLSRLSGRPCLAVLCGGSEVAQQVAMLGLDPALASGPLYGELLPSLVTDAGVDAAYVPSAPFGGDLPFRPQHGVANYYGVGAYLRPLEDARRSEVRFAAECLAFANVPDEEALKALDRGGEVTVHDPRWKAGVPRDVGAGWDFDDVRDHYLRLLFEVDPVGLRSTDHERYLELSRTVTGEVMAEVFGEWRRTGSPCGGALVLWLTDVVPGAGWGLLDHRGEPKPAYHELRRLLSPVAVWSTDEGLGGIDVHVANDGPDPLSVTLRFAFYRDFEVRVAQSSHELELGRHAGYSDNLERLLGRFVDVSWAYRFGEPAQDLIVMSLEQDGGAHTDLLSQAFRMPAGRPRHREPAERLGVSATIAPVGEMRAIATVSATRFLYGVRIAVPGFRAREQGFSVEPGHTRRVELVAEPGGGGVVSGSLTAINLAGRASIDPVAG